MLMNVRAWAICVETDNLAWLFRYVPLLYRFTEVQGGDGRDRKCKRFT